MRFRKIISLSIAISFVVLLVTGVLSYAQVYSRSTATIHTVFGILFTLGVAIHASNNIRPLKKYGKGKSILSIVLVVALLSFAAFHQVSPFNELMNFGAKQKANTENGLNLHTYQVVAMDISNTVQLSIDAMRSQHYWHPQMAVWIEDEQGNYLKTLFVTKATAKGLFFGGRSKDNFKTFDENKEASGEYRRVNALPVWSHKRGVVYSDGLYVPTYTNPLPDAITGETIIDNFKLLSSVDTISKFNLRLEINVAFDDNEYYSAYDFPDDEVFHNGTGQLGQPSIVFQAAIDLNDGHDYYLMELMGHGHRSGQDGTINTDLSTLTTAKQIIERIVVGVKTDS